MKFLPAMTEFGPPANQMSFSNGTLAMWSVAPFVATQIEGYADITMAMEIDLFYKSHFPQLDFVVTVHDWSKMTDYDIACRKIMQQLIQYMRPKQQELILHLGPTTSLGQKIIRTTVETIGRLRKKDYEIFDNDVTFESRIRDLLKRYPDKKRDLI